MLLKIDGRPVDAQCGESLLYLVRKLGLDSADLRTRPLAANVAGETFTLNYVPVREQEGKSVPRAMLRRAVRAANGEVSLLRYDSARGNRVYERTMLFVFLLAMRKLYPKTRVRINYAVGAGLYASVGDNMRLTEPEVLAVKREMRRIVEADLTLERKRVDVDDAIDFFSCDGQEDKVRLLRWRQFSYFDVYRQEDYVDYFYGEMAPSTGYANVFDLQALPTGLFLIRPSAKDPNVPAKHVYMPHLAGVFSESEEWGRLMHCTVVADLNDMVLSGDVRTLIRVNEALHEKRFAALADEIIERGARAVVIAGPSSSGKTTSANRLCTQLRVHGKTPVLVSLDDYYRDRDTIKPGPDGKIDLEHFNTIDVEQFQSDLTRLMAGEEVELPRFDFIKQRRCRSGVKIRVDESAPLVIEGLHGLNPQLLPGTVDKKLIFRLYVSALTTLNLDDHNRIPTTSIRLLRRMVRDYETRGASIERTLSMWDSVRAGEEKWIFPFQEDADAIFNTTLIYEPAVLKKHIFPLLTAVQLESPYYDEAHSIVKFLNYFMEANVEDEIPPTSILREFIGGNTFYQ
ncbi:MAG TPA: nucleoside kinase [Eubacteriales bacterium]|nr:nucleoside kinase [Eubacteriales bacterium]